MHQLRVASVAPFEGVKLVKYGRFDDERGYFAEPFRASQMADVVGAPIVQMNESLSHAGVLRGLHFQWAPFMGKLVRVIDGYMVDIVCDIRVNSPTYGVVQMVRMLPGSGWIWVPPGFAHGNAFPVRTRIQYLCTGEYSQETEACLSPLGTDLDWSLCDPAVLEVVRACPTISMKDRDGYSAQEWLADERSMNFLYEDLR